MSLFFRGSHFSVDLKKRSKLETIISAEKKYQQRKNSDDQFEKSCSVEAKTIFALLGLASTFYQVSSIRLALLKQLVQGFASYQQHAVAKWPSSQRQS